MVAFTLKGPEKLVSRFFLVAYHAALVFGIFYYPREVQTQILCDSSGIIPDPILRYDYFISGIGGRVIFLVDRFHLLLDVPAVLTLWPLADVALLILEGYIFVDIESGHVIFVC